MQSGAIYLSQGFEDCILGSSLILCSCLLLRLTLTTPTEKQNKILRLTVPKKSLCTWLEECCRQVEAEEVSNNRNKIHQTTYKDFFRALYKQPRTVQVTSNESPLIFDVDLFIEQIMSPRLNGKLMAENDHMVNCEASRERGRGTEQGRE